MSEAVCPACGEDIQFEENFQVGHNTVCPNCKELLAVVRKDSNRRCWRRNSKYQVS